ncbi:MAG: hypothetical protein R3B96_16545 [Pirellulaceae bacterium]
MLMCCQVLKCDSVLRWSALIGMFVALLVVGCGPMDESAPGRNVNSSQDNATETPTPDAATADTSSSDDSSTPPTVGTDSQPPESTPETTASTTPQVPSNEAPETESTAPVSSPESEPTTVASNPPASTNEGNEPSGEPTEPGEEPAAPSDDPVAPGEEIVEYEGWGEPAVVFFVTGRQNGYIEPCGCTGLANQRWSASPRHHARPTPSARLGGDSDRSRQPRASLWSPGVDQVHQDRRSGWAV